MGRTSGISERTFGNQAVLPTLPVPELDETCERFIEWAGPLLDKRTLDNTIEATRRFASEGGPGPVLQAALREFSSRKDIGNWLEPFWERMYLSGRAPLHLYSNIFYMFAQKLEVCDNPQCRRAAELVSSALRFKSLVDMQDLKPDMERGQPLCMIQYGKMFSSARIPQKGMDRLRTPVSGEDPTSIDERHIVVISGGRFFSVDVVDASGKPFSTSAIETSLKRIMDLERNAVDPVGVLTSLPRDVWAEARVLLKVLSPINSSSLDTIERALFVLCLDEVQPENIEAMSENMLIGDGCSRWFDKGMQFIICPDGTTAINMEHTATDGSVMVRFAGFVDSASSRIDVDSPVDCGCSWREIRFVIDKKLKLIISRAMEEFLCRKADTSTKVLMFGSFGKELIKGLSVAPDAFIQMALQMAQHEVWGYPRSTYEAVMTRQFLHGRTEAVRTVSRESVEFTRIMRDPLANVAEKSDALRRAIEKHVSRMKEAKAGRGVERHLFGLLNIWLDMGQDLGIPDMPGFFEDPGWKTLRRTLLSTSTSATDGMRLAGFGTVDDEGLGVRYLAFPDSIRFNVTSRAALGGKMDSFVKSLEAALHDMAQLLESSEA
ncbi:MAG: choline/carnitine O-acyltransferase [Thermovirga sp.]